MVKTKFKRDHNLGENKQGKLNIHSSHIRGWVSEDRSTLCSSWNMIHNIYFLTKRKPKTCTP